MKNEEKSGSNSRLSESSISMMAFNEISCIFKSNRLTLIFKFENFFKNPKFNFRFHPPIIVHSTPDCY